MNKSNQTYIIIGAGQAGGQAAISLRQAGFQGRLIIIGQETALPYQRPPLSKAYLKGELADDRLYLRPENFYKAQNLTLRLGESAIKIDRDERTVLTSSGDHLHYSKLLFATGASPRRLEAPGANLGGIHYLRTLSDSNTLRPALSLKDRIVIIGAGYIGLEVAAVARQSGCNVTVLEAADRVLARVSSKPISEFYEGLHRSAGVELRFGVAVESFLGVRQLEGVRLASGETIECSAALVGIGAVPEVSLAADAGLKISDGIAVDENARTSDPNIWAAGDCTNFPSRRYGRRMRLESVPNAIEQAKAAGVNMAGGSIVYDGLPWFWSDQYDVKLQTVGLSHGHDEFVLRGEPAQKSFSVWYFRKGALLAVDAVNDAPSFLAGKKLISERALPNRGKITDPSFDLKSLTT